MQLAGSSSALRAMRDAVDHHSAHPTNTLAAIVVEGNWVFAVLDQPLVYDIKHLEERHILADIVRIQLHHFALG
jgi:hypothetical protein